VAVSSHLVIDIDEYDERIRTFVPYYEEMLDVVAHVLALREPNTVTDLGVGTGALSARIADVCRGVALTGIDEDAGMLSIARRRLAVRHATLVHDSFLDATLPRCDAIMASLALHHIETQAAKQSLFVRAHAALRRGGVFVSADCHPPTADWLADKARRMWQAHLAAHYGKRKAGDYLRAWAKEDFYTTLDTEMRLMQSAGFAPDVVWRRDAFAVIVAERASVSGRRRRSDPFRRPAGRRSTR
jgi:SAM-dependent methyltransferase